MKPLTKRSPDFQRQWFGSASERCQREETASPTVMLPGCPDHGMLPHVYRYRIRRRFSSPNILD